MDKKQVVVIGRNYTSLLNMIRSVGEAGYEVTVIRTVRKIPSKKQRLLAPEAASKYVKSYGYAIEPDGETLVKKLLRIFKGEKNVVILPVDDFVASTLDLYQDQLKDIFVFPHMNHETGAVIRLMDKDVQKEEAKAAGLLVAEGWVAEVKDGSYVIPEGIRYPVFTKPQISIKGDKRCMRRCDTLEELETVIKEVAEQGDCPILIEEFVEIEKEYGVLGFCGVDEVVLPCFVDKLEIGHGSHQGVTLLGEVHPMEEYKEIQDKLKAFLKSTGFVGLVDIDLYESNGVLYFNELNLRLGAFGFAAMCAGINMPAMLVDTLLGNDISDYKKEMEDIICCVSEKVNLDDYHNKFISYKEYKNNLKKADYRFLKRGSDPKPYGIFKIREMKTIVKRMIKK